MAFKNYDKDPADVLDYLNNWRADADPFLAEAEVIASSAWVAYDPTWALADDITIDSDSHTDTTATVWLSGGVAGAKYLLTNHIVTDQGREKDWTTQITCKEQ